MSRSSAPVLTSLLLLLLLPPLLLLEASLSLPASTASDIGCSLRSCAALDVALLQDYVNSLNGSTAALNDTDASGSATVELQPFGALPSDWSRLLLLQNRQPEGTPLHDNLMRLSRLMLVAYFDSEDRDDWEIHRQNGSNGMIGNLIVVPYTEFEDQQANNINSNSTAEKESSWFNASFSVVDDVHDNEGQLRGRNSSENEEKSTTESYYDISSFTIGTTYFTQTFSSSLADNETSGNKSNETFAASNNEGELFQDAACTSRDSFASSTPQSNEFEGDNNRSSSFIIIEDSFASPVSSDKGSSESISANEAIHERSKESFAVSRLRIKDNKDESEEVDEVKLRSFSAVARDVSIGDHSIKSHRDPENNHNKSATNPLVGFDYDSNRRNDEELLTQSIEDFFALEDESNRTGVSNFANSTNLLADDVETKHFRSSETSEELLTKSIEDFFSSKEEPNTTVTESAKIYNESEENFYESSNESDKFMNLPGNNTNVSGNILKVNGERDEIVSRILSSSKPNKVLEQSIEKSNEYSANWTNLEEVLVENLTSAELITSELFLTTNPSVYTSNQSIVDFYKLGLTKSDKRAPKRDNLDVDKLISSVSVAEPPLNTVSSGELNSTREEKNDDNPTTLAQLISRSFSGAILAVTAVYSNEITVAFDSTSALPNGTEDRSGKFPNIPVTISPNLLGNTKDQEKDDEKAHIPESELSEGFENRTTDLTDDLFRKTAMKRRLEDDWGSTTDVISIERTSSDEVTNASSPTLRNIFMTYRHSWTNSTPAVTKLRKVEESFLREDEDQDEKEEDSDSWELNDRAFSLSTTSSRNHQYKRSNGIAAGATMNKRKSRQRVGAEADVERQYRTFFGLKSRQTQKKEDEDTGNQGADVAH